jgi:hypothetical protein
MLAQNNALYVLPHNRFVAIQVNQTRPFQAEPSKRSTGLNRSKIKYAQSPYLLALSPPAT